MVTKKKNPSWSDLKSKLSEFDRAGLLGLVQDLYAANKDNKAFLHARFGLGDDVLEPYKAVIERWLWPDVLKGQDISVAKAKKPIADYRKAVGAPEGLAELMVFYCEQAVGFATSTCLEDEGYFDALVRMFEQTLKAVVGQPEPQRERLLERFDEVRRLGQEVGWGVGEDFDDLWRKAGLRIDE